MSEDKMIEEQEQIVQMLDEETGEELTMQVYPYTCFKMKDHTYAVLTPHETVVKILREIPDEEDDEVFSLEELEPAEYQEIQRFVAEALKPWNCKISIRADEFILEGEPPEEFFEREDMEEPIEVETEDGDEDSYIVLQRIDTAEQQYLIVMSETPELYPAEMISDDKARRLTDDELEKLQDVFEEKLQDAEEKLDAECGCDCDDCCEEEPEEKKGKKEKGGKKGGKKK